MQTNSDQPVIPAEANDSQTASDEAVVCKELLASKRLALCKSLVKSGARTVRDGAASRSKFKSAVMNAMAAPGGNPEKVDYPTPQEWFDYLDLEFGFTLDPCCAHGTAKCAKHYTEAEDGLSKSWEDERVFMNPPYGRNIGPWMEKAYAESKRGALVVCFVPARVDTNWWHDYAIKGEIRLPKGRCKNADGSAWPFPVAVVIYRPRVMQNGRGERPGPKDA